MKILTVPNPILTTPAKPVSRVDKKIKKLVAEMTEILNRQRDPEGVGLAAPQVGVPLQLFIIKPRKNASVEVFINPEIVSDTTKNPSTLLPLRSEASRASALAKARREEKKLEGCLSIPLLWGHVAREKTVTVKHLDLYGEPKKAIFSGLKALIIQHEMDHLQGILFTARVLEQGEKLFKETEGDLAPYSI